MWLVNLGLDYTGKVPRISVKYDVCLYSIDDLACYTFHGAPPDGWAFSYVHHIDGDYQHRAPSNLTWASFSMEKENVEAEHCFWTNVYRPHQRNAIIIATRPGYMQPDPRWTGAENVPGHIPTSSKRVA